MITPLTHGFTDYLYALFLMASPVIFGFDESSTQTYVALTAAAVVIVYSLLTKYPLGFFKIIPLKAHLIMDVALNIFLIASPYLFGFTYKFYLPFILFGAMGLPLVLLSSTKELREQRIKHFKKSF